MVQTNQNCPYSRALVNMMITNQAERERFRVQRKLMHQGVGIQQVKRYRDFQNDESKVVAYDLLTTPEDYVAHFERYATSVVSIIGFGRRVADPKDAIITEVIRVMHHAADLNVPGKKFPMLLETFPGRFVMMSMITNESLIAYLQSLPRCPPNTPHGNMVWEQNASLTEDMTFSIPSPWRLMKNLDKMTATQSFYSKSSQNTISSQLRFPRCLETCSEPGLTHPAAHSSRLFSP